MISNFVVSQSPALPGKWLYACLQVNDNTNHYHVEVATYWNTEIQCLYLLPEVSLCTFAL